MNFTYQYFNNDDLKMATDRLTSYLRTLSLSQQSFAKIGASNVLGADARLILFYPVDPHDASFESFGGALPTQHFNQEYISIGGAAESVYLELYDRTRDFLNGLSTQSAAYAKIALTNATSNPVTMTIWYPEYH